MLADILTIKVDIDASLARGGRAASADAYPASSSAYSRDAPPAADYHASYAYSDSRPVSAPLADAGGYGWRASAADDGARGRDRDPGYSSRSRSPVGSAYGGVRQNSAFALSSATDAISRAKAKAAGMPAGEGGGRPSPADHAEVMRRHRMAMADEELYDG